MTPLFNFLPKRTAKTPLTSEAVALQLEAAQVDLAQAEAAYGTAALAALDDPEVNLDTAEQGVTDAKRRIALLDAALAAAHVREDEQRRAAIAKQHACEDAEVRRACALVLKQLPGAVSAIAAYVSAIAPLTEAYARMHRLAYANPRARNDLAAAMPSLDSLLANELARLAPEGGRVPGQNPQLRHTTSLEQIKSLSDEITGTVSNLMPERQA